MKNTLFWKIALTFLGVLLLLSFVYTYISVFTAEMYFQEAHQNLNRDVAKHIAMDNKYFIDDKVNEEVLKEVFYNIMIINPSLEVYFLDTKGNILTYYAPDKIIKLNKVPLEPMEEFIEEGGSEFLLGPDPKNPGAEKSFSAAKVFEDSLFRGYVYVILGGEEFENSFQLVYGSYMLRLGVRSMAITLLAAILISLLALVLITRRLRSIMNVIREFKNGNLSARIVDKGSGELKEFSETFNEMADTIVRHMEEIKTMDNLRRDLVANVSHDLRTPLATINGYMETILIKSDKISDAEREKYLRIIFKSAERLKKLVEELFELSKLEAKEKIPKPEPFSVAELVHDVQQKNQLIAEKNKIDIRIIFPYDLPLGYADIGMMEKVLQNLIDNALKFTPENGSITLILEKDDGKIIVKVKDSGIGIKEEELPHIFDRYHKTNRSEQKENEGLGLGLMIVKKILEVHNLDINVSSSEGEGTIFSFIIPVYKEESHKMKSLSK